MADGGTETMEHGGAAITEAVTATDDAAFDDVTFTVGELFESCDQVEEKTRRVPAENIRPVLEVGYEDH